MPTLSHRYEYTKEQLSLYFTHISLPRHHHAVLDNPTLDEPNTALEFLTTLQRHHLATVPFENLSLHYSSDRTVSLDPAELYEKIVHKGRGGYCMENNRFFGTVVRSLGYDIYSAGARVSNAVGGQPDNGFLGWSHMVNILTIPSGRRFLLDVGFGANGPTQPLPLVANEVSPGVLPQELRLVYEKIEENTNPDQRLWIYQSRNTPHDEWMPTYCFTELEFLPQDYEIMSFYTSQSRKSMFTYRIMVVKMELEDEQVTGTLILIGGELKRRVGGKTEKLETCNTEKERVQALKKWFGIELKDEEKRGIKGLVTELVEG